MLDAQYQESKTIILSQIINFRLNCPRPNERELLSHIRKKADEFQIEQWQKWCNPEQLYEMSLTGHLIRAIESNGGKATLKELIEITNPHLPFLRKLNGKNFTGQTIRVVKGCLSAIVFQRNEEQIWHLDFNKVEEFKKQANEKLNNYFEKLKRNFPRIDDIRIMRKKQKKAQKSELDQYKYTQVIKDEYDPHSYFGEEENNKNDEIDHWHLGLYGQIMKNLELLKEDKKMDDTFLGVLLRFSQMRQSLAKTSECKRLLD